MDGRYVCLGRLVDCQRVSRVGVKKDDQDCVRCWGSLECHHAKSIMLRSYCVGTVCVLCSLVSLIV